MERAAGLDTINLRVRKIIDLFEKDQVKHQEKAIIPILGETFEEVLGPKWWSQATRLTRGEAMSGSCYRVRYEVVARDRDLRTDLGRGRLLFKHLMASGLVARVMTVLQMGEEVGRLARLLDSTTWQELSLDCTVWLDFTWHLPSQELLEFVPSLDLGINVVLVQGWPVVTSVLPGSVAAEDDKVETGDIVTHINKVSVVGASNTDKILGLINKAKGKPILLGVTKCFEVERSELYSATLPLIRAAGIDVEELQRRYFLTKHHRKVRNVSQLEDFNPLEDQDEESEKVRPGYTCLYIGSVNVGCSGDFDRIEFGIRRVLSCLPGGGGHITLLQLSDIEVKLFQYVSEECILRFVYPQIASCGRLVSKPNYFAFISLPSKDGGHSRGCMCHVFYSSSQVQVKDILNSISDGFQRTHFAV